MIKKNIMIFVIILLAAAVTGQVCVCSFPYKSMGRIKTAEQRQEMVFCFEASLDGSCLEMLENGREGDVEDTGKDSECIAVVKPTGAVSMAPSCSWCEAEVMEVIKGGKLISAGNRIQLMENVQPMETGKEDCPYEFYGAVGNFMQQGRRYLVCFDSYKKVIGAERYEKYDLPFDHYFQISGGWFTCLNLDQEENLTVIEEGKTYLYSELETMEFFSTSGKTLKALYQTKELVIDKLMKNSAPVLHRQKKRIKDLKICGWFLAGLPVEEIASRIHMSRRRFESGQGCLQKHPFFLLARGHRYFSRCFALSTPS